LSPNRIIWIQRFIVSLSFCESNVPCKGRERWDIRIKSPDDRFQTFMAFESTTFEICIWFQLSLHTGETYNKWGSLVFLFLLHLSHFQGFPCTYYFLFTLTIRRSQPLVKNWPSETTSTKESILTPFKYTHETSF